MASLLALALLTQPVSAAAQLALALSVIGLMIAVWWLPRGRLSRHTFLALGSLVVIRYVTWRVTATLPPMTDPVGLGLGLMLLAAELYCVLILAISLVINADPLERAALPRDPDEALPSVDVFVPSYNEDSYILATTIAAAKAMDYPADKLTVWLLDDGGTDQKCADRDPAKAAAARARRAELTRLCEALGARYLTRARNEHAKAGNLNNGLKASAAEIVVVFDADHAPFRSFLTETVGHFARDPKLFLVQTPHVFLNPDPIERNLRTFERMPSENEMFYAVTQRGLDKWNGSFFCGSAALLRRRALAETNGFSGITITEDCETAFELHARGWTSVYVDKPLIAGLQPETFASFIGQRSRWCQGMFQIMLLKNPALKPGLRPIQRLAYLSSMTFWFFPLPRLAFMLAPLLHIFFDVKIFVSSLDEAVAYTATYVVVNLMLQNYLYGHVRWPWVSELYEYVQGVYLARAIVAVVASPRRPTFAVTAKGVSLEKEHLSPLAWPFVAIFALLLVGTATAGYRYLFEPGVTGLMLVVGLWSLFNLVIASVALGTVAERPTAERNPGLAVVRRGVLTLGDREIPVAITRASAGGLTARPDETIDLGALDLGRLGAAHGHLAVVPTVAGADLPRLPVLVGAAEDGQDALNLAFVGLEPGDYRAVADLVYGDAGAVAGFLAGRRRHKNLLAGSLQFVAWGASEPVRALRYGLADLHTWLARTPAVASAPVLADIPAIIEAPVAARVADVAPPVVALRASAALEAPLVVVRASVEPAAPPLVVRAPVTLLAVEAIPAPAAHPMAARAVLDPQRWLDDLVTLARDELGVGMRGEGARAGADWMASLVALAAAEAQAPAAPQAPAPPAIPSAAVLPASIVPLAPVAPIASPAPIALAA